MSQSSPTMTREQIRGMAVTFQTARVLLTACELGIFTVLGDKTLTSAAVAKTIGADARSTDRLMNALCAMGLLSKKNDLFSNTPASAQYLVRERPDYLAGLMHTVHLWDTWSTLTDAVRRGTSVVRRDTGKQSDRQTTAFIAAMHDRAAVQASKITSLVDLSDVTRVLDVGGGSAVYSMAFVRARPGITATVFDLPSVVPLTRSYIEKEGLSARVNVVAGDYLRDTFGTGFDLVFLSAIVHSNSNDQNTLLIGKCAHALRPGGRVVVQDFVMDEDRVHPEHGALFALNMLVGTDAGDTFTEREIRDWMNAAGLADIIRQETPFGTTQIIGRKPLAR